MSKSCPLYHCSLSPEQLFLDWALQAAERDQLESLARATNIAIIELYLQSAKYHFLLGEVQRATHLLDYSQVRSVSSQADNPIRFWPSCRQSNQIRALLQTIQSDPGPPA